MWFYESKQLVATYKTYTQEELDRQYNNRLQVPHFQDYLDRWERRSRSTEQTLPLVKDLRYGDSPRETLDIFPAERAGSKTLVFLHGGWWHLLDKSRFYFLADGFRRQGINTVLLNYPLAPEASMGEIVASCRKAIPWLYSHSSAFKGDPEQLYVAGHSAGGHLAAMLVATDWKRFGAGVPKDVLKGAVFVSGLFDLEPIRHSYLNTVLGMDEEAAVHNSPARLQPVAGCPVVVAVGGAETTAFQDQSKALYAGWKAQSDSRFLSLPGLNHYDVVEAMTEPGNALQQAIGRLLGV